MRIGFLFNHYSPHQMPHAAPYAYELSRRYPEFEVVIVTSSEAEVAMARSIGALYPGHRLQARPSLLGLVVSADRSSRVITCVRSQESNSKG